jgi:hypothetical protein
MNDHLTFRSPRYCDLRRRQLAHRNLHDAPGWQSLFSQAGYRQIERWPYIAGGQCELWDRLDAPICVGISGRWNIGAALRLVARTLPRGMREAMYRLFAHWIARKDSGRRRGPPCVAAIVATK